MLVRDPVCSCPASKGTRLKAQFSPTEYSWAWLAGKMHSKGVSLLQPGTASRPEAAQSGEFGTVSAAGAVCWELEQQ